MLNQLDILLCKYKVFSIFSNCKWINIKKSIGFPRLRITYSYGRWQTHQHTNTCTQTLSQTQNVSSEVILSYNTHSGPTLVSLCCTLCNIRPYYYITLSHGDLSCKKLIAINHSQFLHNIMALWCYVV